MTTAPPTAGRRAVVTSLYTDANLESVRVLGHSLRQHNFHGDLVLLYSRGQLSEESLCLARQVGWLPRVVDRIGHGEQSEDQYTKLRIWELEEYDKLMYMDADTLVVGDVNDVFAVPHDFAAVPDTLSDRQELGFNDGVLVVRPSRQTFHHLMKSLTTTSFSPDSHSTAGQALLREHFKADVMLLPYKFNINLAQIYHPDIWSKVWFDARVVHFTDAKPFQASSEQFLDQFNMWYRVRDSLEAVTNRTLCV